MPQELEIEVVVSSLFAENAYIVRLPENPECLIVDPGFDHQEIIDVVRSRDLTPAAILNTHGHSDHIAGNDAMKQAWPDCPLVIGAGDAEKLTDPAKNLSAAFGAALVSPPADVLVHHGETYEAAGIALEVRDTPGHSAGHVVFLWSAGSPQIVLGGDVLFRGGVGRTDFPDGSFEQLEASIRQQLYTLPEDTRILPGHGPETTIGLEKKTNPFIAG